MPRRRGVIAALLIACQFLTATGIFVPIAGSSSGKDASQPFPCLDRPCGCRNADQCWHHCCCFTMREKVAWARAHGIEPPEFVCQAAAAEEALESRVADVSTEAPTATCCQAAADLPAAKKSCCCCQHAAPSHETPSAPIRQPATKGWVIGMLAAQCQGYGPLGLLSAVPSLPATPPASPLLPLECCDTIRLSSDRPQEVSLPPSVPPPRVTRPSLHA